MFTALATTGILRAAPEEWTLSALHQPRDVLAAEFFRTCRRDFFSGKRFLRSFDSATPGAEAREATVTLSKSSRERATREAESAHGFRPRHPCTWHASP